MDTKPGQSQNSYKRNWRQQKCFYREWLQISWAAKLSNYKPVLEEADTARPFKVIYANIKQSVFGHVRREKLEHYLMTNGMIERKCSKGKQREMNWLGLALMSFEFTWSPCVWYISYPLKLGYISVLQSRLYVDSDAMLDTLNWPHFYSIYKLQWRH